MHKNYQQLKNQIIQSGSVVPNQEAKLRVQRSKEQQSNFFANRKKAKELRGFELIAELPKPKVRLIEKFTHFLKNE